MGLFQKYSLFITAYNYIITNLVQKNAPMRKNKENTTVILTF